MESALYGFSHSLVLYQKSHSFAALTRSMSGHFIYFTNSCENPVRTRFPWSNLYICAHALPCCMAKVTFELFLRTIQSSVHMRIAGEPVSGHEWTWVHAECLSSGISDRRANFFLYKHWLAQPVEQDFFSFKIDLLKHQFNPPHPAVIQWPMETQRNNCALEY